MPSLAGHSSVRELFIPYAVSRQRTACLSCYLSAVCLPHGVARNEIARLDSLIDEPRKLRQGQYLYRNGEAFDSIYLVRTGCFKTLVLTGDGREQVAGFQMAGDLLGSDGISDEVHTCDAVALEDSQVCALPFARLEALAPQMPGVLRHVHKLMSREVHRDHSAMLLLGTLRAERRLAAFLLNFAQRLGARGAPTYDFHLRMKRREIASYLGLSHEVVCRTMTGFQDDGVLTAQQKHIRILDWDRLTAVAGGRPRSEPATPATMAAGSRTTRFHVLKMR